MADLIHRLYWRLPAPARSAVATLRGRQLRSWRYGAETDRLVQEALEREHWSPQKWSVWQEERLAFILHRAATQVPFYRDHWTKRRRSGDQASWQQLDNWPILQKQALRDNPRSFVADDCDIREMFHEHTSGTTGTSLNLWWSRRMVQEWYALFEARWRLWYGVSRRSRWAILGGQLVVAAQQQKPPFWVWNAGLNQLYMSAYHISAQTAPAYLEALERHRIEYLWGYSSSLHALAQAAAKRERATRLKVVITNAEPLFDYQKSSIAETFGCPVRETYGMAEAVAAASECEAGNLHLWPEAGLVEFCKAGQIVPQAMQGELICTGLFNEDMPLIRYRVGDCGSLSSQPSCACGRTLPLLAQVEGRADDVLWTRDGRSIGRLDPIFKDDLPVLEAQIIQETLEHIRVRYVPAPTYVPACGRTIIERLQDRMGEVRVTLEPVDEIPRGPNGKFRAVLCNLPPEQRPSL